MIKRFNFVFLVAIIFVSSCVSSSYLEPRPIKIEDSDPYLHKASEISCPNNINYFYRVSILQYDESEHNVSCGYGALIGSEPMVIAVYIYPMWTHNSVEKSQKQTLLKHHFNSLLQLIESNESDFVLLNKSEAHLNQEAFNGSGLEAEFRFNAKFSEESHTINSHFKLFYKDNWFIKYRISYPADKIEKSKSIIDLFMNDFKIS